MKKTIKLFFIVSLILLVCCGCTKNKKTYTFGELIKVKLNENLEKEFYVIKDERDTLKLLSKELIGKSKYNDIQEGYGCQFYGDCQPYNKYAGSIIESQVKELTKEWTNVQSVSLLDITDLIEPLNIENKYFYKRSSESLKLTDNYFEIFKDSFWLYNTYEKSLNFTWTIADNTIEIKNITEENNIRPLIVIGKKSIN